MPKNRLVHVAGACRQVAAVATDEGGKGQLIGADRRMRGPPDRKSVV